MLKRYCLVLGCALALFACSSDNNKRKLDGSVTDATTNDSSSSADAAQQGVGPAGGTVELAGVKLEIPAGALDATTQIAVSSVSSGYPAVKSGTRTVSLFFALTPHGLTFKTPVTLTIPLKTTPTGTVTLYHAQDGGTSWSAVSGATTSGNKVSAQINGFSYYMAGEPDQCVNPASCETKEDCCPGYGCDSICYPEG
ncbi:MAG: hypothetical protein H6707_17595 [Deltaproteobacteria bacterium]|nr:hypothetical protein [Deltaproteobacteria bacterium]